MRPGVRILMVAFATLSFAHPAFAEWTLDGVMLTSSRGDREVKLSPDGAGGVVVSGTQLEGQIFAPWPYALQVGAVGVLVPWPRTPWPLLELRAIGDGAGGSFEFDFEDHSTLAGNEVHHVIRHRLADGSFDPTWPAEGAFASTNLHTGRQVLRLALDGVGGVYGTWLEQPDFASGRFGFRATRVSATGGPVPGWPANGRLLRDSVAYVGLSTDTRCWPDGSGGLLAYLWPPRAYRLQADGSPASGWPDTGLVPLGPTAAFAFADVTPASDGGMLLAWNEGGAPGGSIAPGAMRVLRVTGAGVLAPGWSTSGVVVNAKPDTSSAPRVVSDGAGGAFVAWLTTANANARELRVQHVLADGPVDPAWPAGGRNLGSAPAQLAWPEDNPSGFVSNLAFALEPDGIGGVIVAWDDVRDGTVHVRAMRLDASGADVAGWPAGGLAVHTPTMLGQLRAMVRDETSGDLFVAWRQTTIAPFGTLRLSRVRADGVVPVQVALVSAHAAAGRVHAEWWLGPASVAWQIERRVDDGPWKVLGPAIPDGTGRVTLDADGGAPGAHVSLRLATNDGGTRRVEGEVTLVMPREASLALAAPAPNPAGGAFSVRCALAADDVAEVALFDVSGRRVESRAIRGAGEHVVRFGDGTRLAPGVYGLRLTQGGQVRTTRVAVVR